MNLVAYNVMPAIQKFKQNIGHVSVKLFANIMLCAINAIFCISLKEIA
jgi:hypothetical protein